MKKVLLSAAVSAALALTATFALAETADVTPDQEIVVAQAAAQPRAEAAPAARQHEHGQRAFRMPSERVEARLAYAKTALKITDAQQPQWESFANVLRKHARDMDQRFQQMRAKREAAQGAQAARPQPSAIERLERRQQRMAQGSVRLNEVITAAKPLYAALSPEQKQIADGMLARQGHGRGGGHHQHRGMHRGA